MAVLTEAILADVRAVFMRDKSALREVLATVTKADLLAAVAAMDAWIDANMAVFNAAIPEPARSALTAQQKVELFMAVLIRRVKG